MGFIKRAWLSVVRRKGKSLILLIVVFILGNLIAGTFAIKQATQRVEENLKTKLGFNATVTVDYETIFSDYDHTSLEEPKIPTIPSELIKRLGTMPEVSYYDYSRKSFITTNSIKGASFEDMPMNDVDGNFMFNLHGVEHLDVLDTKVGRIELVDGRVFNKDDLEAPEIPVILSDEVMSKNNFRLDEVIEVKSIMDQMVAFDEEQKPETVSSTLKFKIVGTFKPITFGKKTDNNWNILDMLNRIYMPNQSVDLIIEDIIRMSEENGVAAEDNSYLKDMLADNYQDSVFVTESEADLKSFVAAASEGLEENVIIKTSQEALSVVAGQMSLLRDFADVTLKGSVIITVIVLSLVVVLFLRDRKHEMGIYLALGDHQWRVLTQVTLEVVMITLMGLTLSFGSAMVLANKVSDSLMFENFDGDVNIPSDSYIPAINLSEVDEDYTIKITPSYVLLTYSMGIGVAVAASVIPMFYVTRVKPKKILM